MVNRQEPAHIQLPYYHKFTADLIEYLVEYIENNQVGCEEYEIIDEIKAIMKRNDIQYPFVRKDKKYLDWV